MKYMRCFSGCASVKIDGSAAGTSDIAVVKGNRAICRITHLNRIGTRSINRATCAGRALFLCRIEETDLLICCIRKDDLSAAGSIDGAAIALGCTGFGLIILFTECDIGQIQRTAFLTNRAASRATRSGCRTGNESDRFAIRLRFDRSIRTADCATTWRTAIREACSSRVRVDDLKLASGIDGTAGVLCRAVSKADRTGIVAGIEACTGIDSSTAATLCQLTVIEGNSTFVIIHINTFRSPNRAGTGTASDLIKILEENRSVVVIDMYISALAPNGPAAVSSCNLAVLKSNGSVVLVVDRDAAGSGS